VPTFSSRWTTLPGAAFHRINRESVALARFEDTSRLIGTNPLEALWHLSEIPIEGSECAIGGEAVDLPRVDAEASFEKLRGGDFFAWG
jgi:hypothetical protein